MRTIQICHIFLAVILSLGETGLAQNPSAPMAERAETGIALPSNSDDLAAELSTSEESIFQKAEVLYPNLFGNASEFRITEGYIYKFYGLQSTYIGVRDNLVYVLGGPFGNSIITQGTVANTLAFLVNEENTQRSAQFDPAFRDAWQLARSNLQLEGTGQVSRILSDDVTGSAHQRFVVRLRSGQTLLIAHNIDLAPRIPAITIGDEVAFFGEYEWSREGGVMHWTHHDPDGKHTGGWIKHKGVTYQ